MINTEKPKEVKAKNLWVRISSIVIGSVIIVGGAVGYYIEMIDCYNPAVGCGILSGGGGIGLFGLTFLGSIFLVLGIIYPYRKRIKGGYWCIMLLLLPPAMAYFLGLLIRLISPAT